MTWNESPTGEIERVMSTIVGAVCIERCMYGSRGGKVREDLPIRLATCNDI